MIDFNQTPADIGELTADMLKGVLAQALQAQQATRQPEVMEPEPGQG